MDYKQKEINSQIDYLDQAEAELKALNDLIQAFSNFSLAFMQIGRFVDATMRKHLESRVKGHKDRIKELQEDDND